MPFDWPSSVEPALRRLSPGQIHLPHIDPEQVKLPKRGSSHFGIISVVLLVAAVILFLLIFDWNWFRPPLARIASDRLNREVAIQGDQLRVTSPSKDELQDVMAYLRGEDYGIELNFGNYR